MGKKPDRTRPPDLTVFADETIDSKGMSIADVLAEPPKQSGLWIGAVARRLIAASARPVALAPIDRKFIERIETAGWFVASRDADTTNARDSCWPSDGALKRIGVGVGNPRPQLVIVGERVSREGQVPFHSRSGAWLFLALRLLGYDELSVYCVNAYSSTRKERFERLRDLRKTFDKFGVDAPWVSFGEGAHIALRQLGMPAREVVSPAYHKKMNQNEGPEGFAELIMSLASIMARGTVRRCLSCRLTSSQTSSCRMTSAARRFVRGIRRRAILRARAGRARQAVVLAARRLRSRIGSSLRTRTCPLRARPKRLA